MKKTADALVYAVTWINIMGLRGAFDDCEDEQDPEIGALESIAGMLRDGTGEEMDALAAAAERALAAELAHSPRKEFVDDYRTWMQDMFGDDEWIGNQRREK